MEKHDDLEEGVQAIADLFGTLLPVSGGMRGLPSTSSSVPLTLNSGDIGDVNLQGCKPTVLVLTYQVTLTFPSRRAIRHREMGRSSFPKQAPEEHLWTLVFLAQTFLFLQGALFITVVLAFVSIDKMNASVLNPALKKLWSKWKTGNFHLFSKFTVRRIKHYLTQLQTKALKHTPMK